MKLVGLLSSWLVENFYFLLGIIEVEIKFKYFAALTFKNQGQCKNPRIYCVVKVAVNVMLTQYMC